ncbi:hypothetical protein HOLleu_28751 [Holothuria leucospilota]|uniref:Uncharacterized protein n=1 Tax=Holothuria leucospilota TaxID=206669 RepID=A0A9Q1BMC0_HOLLE|nr:hypothetical protein HOLleu_28751 [Holothuria leucospilota]
MVFLPWHGSPRKLSQLCLVPIAAETLALTDAIDTGMFLALFYSEMACGRAKPEIIPLECITNNQSLFENLHSTNLVCEKQLMTDISGIKELLQSKQVESVGWSPTKTQPADCLTKKGASSLPLLQMIEEEVWSF